MEVSALQTEAEAITLSAPWRAPLLSTSRKMESLKVSFPVKAVRAVSPEGRFLASDGNALKLPFGQSGHIRAMRKRQENGKLLWSEEVSFCRSPD